MNGEQFAAAVVAAFEKLDASAPAEDIVTDLRKLEAVSLQFPEHRVRYLHALGLAVNRLRFSTEALGYLRQATQLAQASADWWLLYGVERALATVHVWRGEVREATMAMLRAAASASSAAEPGRVALVFADVGRLEQEIGRPGEAVHFHTVALKMGDEMPQRERERTRLNLVQSLVAAKRFDAASAQLVQMRESAADMSQRGRFLMELESARLAQGQSRLADAQAALDRVAALEWKGDEPFELIELAHAQAEVSIGAGDNAKAEELLREVVMRYARDNLAGREIAARIAQAKVLDARGKGRDAEQTLIAALRRAVARGLTGFIEDLRSKVRARGAMEGAWRHDQPIWQDMRDGIEERFVLRDKSLGSGGAGSVNRAYDLELGVEVALKRVALGKVYDTKMRKWLLETGQTEVALASRIEHPGVARVHGMLTDAKGDVLVVQELIDGPNLRELMAEKITPRTALDILARIAFSLAAVHAAGIVHRDIKPENIVIRDRKSPVIVDFGIALFSKASTSSAGTPDYMAPEQASGRSVDTPADMYAFGVMARELLVGDIAPRPSWLASAFPADVSRARRRAELVSRGLQPKIAGLIAALLSPRAAWRPDAASAGAVLSATVEAS
jgi:hypothetical protein